MNKTRMLLVLYNYAIIVFVQGIELIVLYVKIEIDFQLHLEHNY